MLSLFLNFPAPRGTGGVSKETHKLIPTIGRIKDEDKERRSNSTSYLENPLIEKALKREKSLFSNFKKHACLLNKTTSALEIAIIAQHYGLPTRLLDWSYSPLTALHFAVKNHDTKNGAVYILEKGMKAFRNFKYERLIWGESKESNTNFKKSYFYKNGTHLEYFKFITGTFDNYVKLLPQAVTQRVVSQNSFFTIHLDPFTPLKTHIIKKIIIPKEKKRDLYLKLEHMGIHEYSLFPDMTGLAAWLKSTFYSPLLDKDN